MRQKKGVVGVVVVGTAMVLCALAWVLLGCGGEETTTVVSPSTSSPGTVGTSGVSLPGSTATSSPTGSFDGEIVIGAICSDTGVLAMNGAEQKWAQETAVADINARGGINLNGKRMKLTVKFVDDKSDENEAAAAAEKLIKVEGVKIILGTNGTPTNMAAAIVCEKYGVLLHTNFLWTNWSREAKLNFVTNSCFSPVTVSEAYYNMMDQQPEAERPTRWGILTEDNQDGQGLGAALKELAAKHGYRVELYESYTPGSKDFSSSILKMKSGNIDALIALLSPADGITFVRQMKEQRYSPKFIGAMKGFWPIEFVEALGPDADYCCHDGFWSEQLPYPGCAELGQRYRDTHSGKDSVNIGSAYSVVQVLAMAMERAGSTEPAVVRDEIAGGTFPGTVMGDLTYDELGVSDVPTLALQWVDGKRVLLYPGGQKLRWFVPWEKR